MVMLAGRSGKLEKMKLGKAAEKESSEKMGNDVITGSKASRNVQGLMKTPSVNRLLWLLESRLEGKRRKEGCSRMPPALIAKPIRSRARMHKIFSTMN